MEPCLPNLLLRQRKSTRAEPAARRAGEIRRKCGSRFGRSVPVEINLPEKFLGRLANRRRTELERQRLLFRRYASKRVCGRRSIEVWGAQQRLNLFNGDGDVAASGGVIRCLPIQPADCPLCVNLQACQCATSSCQSSELMRKWARISAYE
jgi:hypothetical protein